MKCSPSLPISCVLRFLNDSDTDVESNALHGFITWKSSDVDSRGEVLFSLTYINALSKVDFDIFLNVQNVMVESDSKKYSTMKKASTVTSWSAMLFLDQYTMTVQSSSNSFCDETFEIRLTKENFEKWWAHVPPRFAACIVHTKFFNEIPVESFYANHHQTNNHNRCNENSRNTSETKFYEVFRRQELAFDRLKQLPLEVAIRCKLFSFESIQMGRRLFLLSDIDSFIDQYFKIQPHQRHVYELIPQTFPCRLYYDLEFCRTSNPLVNGEDLVAEWINLVAWKLKEIYDIELSTEDVVVLDSTTEQKFSKHVIFVCRSTKDSTELLFHDNAEAGQFSRSILWDITMPVEKDNKLDDFVIQLDGLPRRPRREFSKFWLLPKAEDSAVDSFQIGNLSSEFSPIQAVLRKRAFFVDMGVYTRNRAFRLYSSSKYGKAHTFRLTANDRKRYFRKFDENSIKQTMISVLRYSFVVPCDILAFQSSEHKEEPQDLSYYSGVVVVDQDDRIIKRLRSNDESKIVEPLDFSRFLSVFNSANYSIFPRMVNVNVRGMDSEQGIRSGIALSVSKAELSVSKAEHSTSTVMFWSSWKANRVIDQSRFGQQQSWFPALDHFVRTYVSSRGGVEGVLSSWMLFFQPNGDFPLYKLRYQIGRNRFCENIGRMHKSNGIYIEVDLMTKELAQACWDSDCKGFKAQPVLIPDGIIPNQVEIIDLITKFHQSSDKHVV
jgi:hypothetical protein